ncbi:hypothetical protein MMC09_000819 [Bachmanniomyces sp. S44760]|nr:hypothetical protein [Bachmanniomyces sp. S44760]
MSYIADSPLHPKLDLHAGLRSHVFQPPPQTSAATISLRTSIIADTSKGTSSRKRTRQGSLHLDDPPIRPSALDFSASLSPSYSQTSTPVITSPAPLTNSQYALECGLDTPTAVVVTSYEYRDRNAQIRNLNHRRGGWNTPVTARDGYFPHVPNALARETNGRARTTTTSMSHESWSRLVATAFGGVAGKVWNFCTAGAFRGFYAGGGRGYAMDPIRSQQDLSMKRRSLQDLSTSDEVFEATNTPMARTSTVETTKNPGGFPYEDFIHDYMSRDHTNESPHPCKRHQSCRASDNISSNWIMVTSTTSRENSPLETAARKIPESNGKSTSSRCTSRATGMGSCRPVLPTSRSSFAGSPGLYNRTLQGQHRPASSASVRSPATIPPVGNPRHNISPTRPKYKHNHSRAQSQDLRLPNEAMSPDAQKYAAKIKRKAMDDERDLKRFNSHLKDLIREGKEALGTKVEILDVDDSMEVGNEGFADSHWDGGTRRRNAW